MSLLFNESWYSGSIYKYPHTIKCNLISYADWVYEFNAFPEFGICDCNRNPMWQTREPSSAFHEIRPVFICPTFLCNDKIIFESE